MQKFCIYLNKGESQESLIYLTPEENSPTANEWFFMRRCRMASLSYKENMLLVLQHKEPEFIPMNDDFNNGFSSVVMETGRDRTKPSQDWFGQYWTFEPTIGGFNPTPGSHLVTDITRWREQMTFPDLDAVDWEAAAERDTAHWDRENKLCRITMGYGLWERMFSVMEFQDALVALLEEPEACFDFFSAVADYKIEVFRRVIHYYKPDQIVFHDDYGNTKAMFMSPETWRELIKPNLQRVIDFVTGEGVFYEHHCCGNFAPIVEEIADMGASSFNTCHVSMHPAELKKRIGHKIAFMGGFDNQFIDAITTTEEQTRKHAREVIDAMAPGGSWCPRFVNSVPEKRDYVNDEIINYGGTHYYTCPRP